MGDDLSTQIFNQTTESIQKLFDLSTRIDERVKTLQIRETEMRGSINNLNEKLREIELKLNKIEGQTGDQSFAQQLQQCQLALIELDKKLTNTLTDFGMRVSAVETSQQGSEDRWSKITNFAFQLIWVIIAAWILATLGLQAPP